MENKIYDYVVIGAGIAGLSAAYHLGKNDHSVLVLEASDGKNSASMASTAEMNHDPDAHWENIVGHFGYEGARQLWELCASGIDILSEFAHQRGERHFGADRVPAYFFSYRDEDTELLRKKYEFYKSIGAHVSFDEHTASSLHPSFRSVLTTHGEGVTNNQLLLSRLAHEVREQGGILLHNKSVTSLQGEEVHTADGSLYKGTHTVIATGDAGASPDTRLLPLVIEIERKCTFVVSYEKHDLPEFFRNSVLWDSDKPYHYTRSFAGNRLWVGGEDVYDSEYISSPEEDEKKYALIDHYAREVLKTDDTYTRQSTWSGLFFPAKRGLPYIGEVPGTSHIASVGFGGTGIITSFISGYLLAAWERGEMLEYKSLFEIGWI